jgi:hypothetical protein
MTEAEWRILVNAQAVARTVIEAFVESQGLALYLAASPFEKQLERWASDWNGDRA